MRARVCVCVCVCTKLAFTLLCSCLIGTLFMCFLVVQTHLTRVLTLVVCTDMLVHIPDWYTLMFSGHTHSLPASLIGTHAFG